MEQLRRLYRCEDRGRFVENQNASVADQRFHDLQSLLRGDGQLLDSGVWVEHQACAVADLDHAFGSTSGLERSSSAKRDIFCNCHHWNVREMLMHHSESGGNGV